MITGTVKGQALRISSPTIAADTISYLTARFVFTSDWDGAVKFAHFSCGEKNYSVPLTDNEIGEGDKLNLGAGTWKVWLHGERYEGGELTQRITTEEALLVVRAIGSFDGEPFPTTPSEIERLHAEFDKVKRGVQSDWAEEDEGAADFVRNRPFKAVGEGLEVDEDGVLSVRGIKKVTHECSFTDQIELADATEYKLTNVAALTLIYPDVEFECWLKLTFAAENTIAVTYPEGTKFIGKKPEFTNGDIWEVSIKDGVVISQKVGDGT